MRGAFVLDCFADVTEVDVNGSVIFSRHIDEECQVYFAHGFENSISQSLVAVSTNPGEYSATLHLITTPDASSGGSNDQALNLVSDGPFTPMLLLTDTIRRGNLSIKLQFASVDSGNFGGGSIYFTVLVVPLG